MKILNYGLLSASLLVSASLAQAGPYNDPLPGQPGSKAVSANSSAIVGWATGFENYVVGDGVWETWQTPENALGEAGNSDGNNAGYTYDIVSLGRGGEITLTFDTPIANGEGYDFAVFENSFNDTFLELAWVEVSSDGTNFFRYPGFSFTTAPVGAFGSVDPTNIDGFAGKYRGGYGTPFDLALWESVSSEYLDIDAITSVKIVDITGDGSEFDNYPSEYGGPNPIYDPYQTAQSAGFDLDAIAVLNAGIPPMTEVPVPAAAWLFMSALGGLSAVARNRRKAIRK